MEYLIIILIVGFLVISTAFDWFVSFAAWLSLFSNALIYDFMSGNYMDMVLCGLMVLIVLQDFEKEKLKRRGGYEDPNVCTRVFRI